MAPTARLIGAACKTILGESPRWCSTSQALSYIDILGMSLYRYLPDSESMEEFKLHKHVGFALPTDKVSGSASTLVIGLEDEVLHVQLNPNRVLNTLCKVPSQFHYAPGSMRFNDAECSPQGNVFAGYMHNKWRDGNDGFYLAFTANDTEPGPSLTKAIREPPVGLPNGAAWLDNNTVYFVDSKSGTITKYSVAADGCMTIEGVVYALNRENFPVGSILDGMTIDDRGNLWVVVSGGGCVLCVDPSSGLEVSRVEVPTSKPTACVFGGSDLQHLYITSRNETADTSEAEGGLYVADIEGVKGMRAACVRMEQFANVFDLADDLEKVVISSEGEKK